MRRAVTRFLIVLCCSAVAHQSATAQRPTGNPARAESASVNEALRALVSRLRDAREVAMPQTNTTWRIGSVSAEGCVLRFTVTREHESHGPEYMNRPQVSDVKYDRADYEWTVPLAELDPSQLKLSNPLRIRGDGWLSFYTAGGRETIIQKWQGRLKRGVQIRTVRQRGGSLPVDGTSLEGVTAALRRAVEVCAASSTAK